MKKGERNQKTIFNNKKITKHNSALLLTVHTFSSHSEKLNNLFAAAALIFPRHAHSHSLPIFVRLVKCSYATKQ